MIVRPIVTRHNGREIETMSPDPKGEYFADGLTEELLRPCGWTAKTAPAS